MCLEAAEGCLAGSSWDGSQCATCSAGEYQDELQMESCKTCPYGWYSLSTRCEERTCASPNGAGSTSVQCEDPTSTVVGASCVDDWTTLALGRFDTITVDFAQQKFDGYVCACNYGFVGQAKQNNRHDAPISYVTCAGQCGIVERWPRVAQALHPLWSPPFHT